MRSNGYVCAFRGRRDDYQVPTALEEADALSAFVTDGYATSAILNMARVLPHNLSDKLCSRRTDRLPDDKITCLWATAALERFYSFVGRRPAEIYAKFDAQYSRSAAAIARRKKANLFLYSAYAWDAFSANYAHDPSKILFQYHPHINTESRILRDDWMKFRKTISERLVLEDFASVVDVGRERADRSWTRATHILCASSFTRRSLIEAGADAARISVVPYGVDPVLNRHDALRDPFFHALFVGSGLQRKGLHHLLLAWQRASLPADSKLTLVCRVVEPALLPLVAATPGVELIRGVSRSQLERLYATATLFTMPSLVEGFGQVYLEALSFGLPVLGTAHTGLPDLGGETDGIYTCEAGNIDELAATLTKLSESLIDARAINEMARQCAGRFPWERFRARIQALL